MNNVLILGGSGFLGEAIIEELSKNKEFDIYSTYFKNSTNLSKDKNLKLNVDDEENICSILEYSKPKIVISCLRGDYKKQLILHKKVAEYLKKTNGKLYFMSTINVFDSDFSRAHYEEDLKKASSDYGKYKEECEENMIKILKDNVCILRLPQVFGKDSPRMKGLLNLLNKNEKVVVWPELYFNTITDELIAKQLSYIIKKNLKGIFHLTSEDIVNYKDFYKSLISKLGFNDAKIEDSLEAKGTFALLSNRYNEFPGELRVTNKLVLEHSI